VSLTSTGLAGSAVLKMPTSVNSTLSTWAFHANTEWTAFGFVGLGVMSPACSTTRVNVGDVPDVEATRVATTSARDTTVRWSGL
jgi:hypothetical protein